MPCRYAGKAVAFKMQPGGGRMVRVSFTGWSAKWDEWTQAGLYNAK